MRQVETVTIGENKFEVAQLPAIQSMAVLNDLLRISATPLVQLLAGIAPGVRAAVQNATDAKKALAGFLSANLDGQAAAPALQALFLQLTPEKQEQLVLALLRHCSVVGEQGPQPLTREVVDVVFRGKVDEMLRLVFVSIRVNYGSFWSALTASGMLRRPGTASKSEPSTTSATQRNG